MILITKTTPAAPLSLRLVSGPYIGMCTEQGNK